MPTYKVTNKRDIENPRVVDAKTPGAARAHVARDELQVSQINVSEAFALAHAGAKLETAGDEPAKKEPFDSGEEELAGN